MEDIYLVRTYDEDGFCVNSWRVHSEQALYELCENLADDGYEIRVTTVPGD